MAETSAGPLTCSSRGSAAASVREMACPSEECDVPIPPPPWLHRTFSRIRPGSIRGSVLSLTCSAIGVGVLLLPYTMARVGVLLALVLLVTAAGASYVSLLICCAGMHVTRSNSYSQTLRGLFSEKHAVVLTTMLVIACFGLTVGYVVFSSQLLQQLLTVAGVHDVSRGTIIAVSACAVTPLCLRRSFSDFRYLSLVSILGLLYLAFLVTLRAPVYAAARGGLDDGWWWRVREPADVLKCLSLCFVAYTVHMNVFQCYQELVRPSPPRVGKVILRSILVQSFIYSLIAVFGFVSFGLNTPDNILYAYRLDDVYANVGRALICFQLLLVVPLTVRPGRDYLWAVLFMAFRRCPCKAPSWLAPNPAGTVGTEGAAATAGCDAGRGVGSGGSGEAPPSALPLEAAEPPASAWGDDMTLPDSDRGIDGLESAADGGIPPIPPVVHVALTVILIAVGSALASRVESASDVLALLVGFANVTYAYVLPAEIAKKLRSDVADSFGADWRSNPAAFVRGRMGPAVVILLYGCGAFGYIAAAQSAYRFLFPS